MSEPFMFSGSELRPDWPWGDLAPSGYDLIMADPPWRFALYSERGEEKSAQAQYATMTLDEIAALPVAELAARDCVLWLWATAPMIDQQIALCGRWGFAFKTCGTWVKTTASGKLAFGTGYVLRNCHEPFLIATRGAPRTSRSIRSAFLAEAREHSRKPDMAFAMAERMLPGARRVELFSRQRRSGWDSWGNETEKFQRSEAAE